MYLGCISSWLKLTTTKGYLSLIVPELTEKPVISTELVSETCLLIYATVPMIFTVDIFVRNQNTLLNNYSSCFDWRRHDAHDTSL